MDKKLIEKLNEEINKNNPEEIISTLTSLSNTLLYLNPDEIATIELDHAVSSIIPIIPDNLKKPFYKLMPSLLVAIKEPRLLYTHLIKETGIHVCECLFHLSKEFNVEVPNLHNKILMALNAELLEEEGRYTLTFLINTMNDRSLCMEIIQRIIKRLCELALEVSSQSALDILHTVLIIMQIHPTCFKMAQPISYKEPRSDLSFFQPYLFELDILYSSLDPLKNIIKRIRSASKKYDLDLIFNQPFPTLTQNGRQLEEGRSK
ncbi:Nucleolar complex protein 4 [Astathelohania contejeani]|uniref:Nucleolar complex protein 4 n=1 Tax=Astathelohania contejeani TaxID=164912 RepID=A0ABQ7I0Q8_9MICR|nr:Nucleolar complex protein 4 [Thelohania contejeani]